MTSRKLVAGNWKMYGRAADSARIEGIAGQARAFPQVDVALCVPAILIERAARAARSIGHSGFAIGGQDVHREEQGAHTGCTSAQMLREAGAALTIVGHSERRDAQRESDAEVRGKASAALASGLDVILCVGESLTARQAGTAVATVIDQLGASLPEIPQRARLAVAYEPIWAIGTGKVPTVDEIGEMHAAIRRCLTDRYGAAGTDLRILYGGSVKASNAAEIFAVPDVDGALVGGASLTPEDFIPIVAAAAASGG